MDLQTWLPLLVIVAVFAIRFRNLNTPRPFRPGTLWIAPLILTIVFGLTLFGMPPSPLGWAVIGMTLLIGALAGWKRGQLMRFERDPRSGVLMARQSPAALLFIVGILFAKRALAAGLGIDPAAQVSGHATAAAMLLTDGLLGFAVGMVFASCLTLWQRAKAVPHPETKEG